MANKAKGPSTFLLTMADIAQPISYKAKVVNSDLIPSDTEAIINDLLVKNPGINAAAFYNLLKSTGIDFQMKKSVAPKPEVTEADSSTANTQVLRSDVKESVGSRFNLRFIETASPQDKSIGFTKFRVVMLSEGMGNMKDAFYYSKEALTSAISIFEGKKIFSDHETKNEAEQRPERSVKDIIGHFENVHIEESEDGRALLVADVIIPPDEPFLWARSLMGHAVEYAKKFPGQDFIGLSINATGSAESKSLEEIKKTAPKGAQLKLDDAKQSGIDTLKVVSKIDNAFSCDLVTEAGAGGKVLSFIERNKKMDENKEQVQPHSDEQQDMELIKKMIAKYMGDGEVTPEECGATKEAYEAYKEMGAKEEEAEEKAVSTLKLARHMASKKKEAGDEEPDKSEDPPAEKKEADEKDPSKLKAESKTVESLRSELLKLQGELSKFHESQKAQELDSYLDKKCKESKLSMDVTKKFKESLGKVKSKDQIDSMWKIFLEGYNSQVKQKTDWSYVVTPGKETLVESKSKFDFGGITKG
jgi:hypothetical protein